MPAMELMAAMGLAGMEAGLQLGLELLAQTLVHTYANKGPR